MRRHDTYCEGQGRIRQGNDEVTVTSLFIAASALTGRLRQGLNGTEMGRETAQKSGGGILRHVWYCNRAAPAM
jgi:hypothetical protein